MNFISRKTIPRRQFLQAAGIGIALPLLDAMTPAFGAAEESNKIRLVCIEEVHGLAGCRRALRRQGGLGGRLGAWARDRAAERPARGQGRQRGVIPIHTLGV